MTMSHQLIIYRKVVRGLAMDHLLVIHILVVAHVGGLRHGDPPIVDEAEADTDAVAVHAVAVVSRAVEFE